MGNPPQNRKTMPMHNSSGLACIITQMISSDPDCDVFPLAPLTSGSKQISFQSYSSDLGRLGTMFFRRNIHLLGHRNPRSGATAAGSSSLWSVDVISRIRERFTTWTSYLRCRWVAVGGWVWTKLQVWNLKMWGETLCHHIPFTGWLSFSLNETILWG